MRSGAFSGRPTAVLRGQQAKREDAEAEPEGARPVGDQASWMGAEAQDLGQRADVGVPHQATTGLAPGKVAVTDDLAERRPPPDERRSHGQRRRRRATVSAAPLDSPQVSRPSVPRIWRRRATSIGIVAVTRIGKIDGEFRLDACGPFAEHDDARREQHGLLDIMRDQNGGEPLVPPEREESRPAGSGA